MYQPLMIFIKKKDYVWLHYLLQLFIYLLGVDLLLVEGEPSVNHWENDIYGK